MEEEIREEVNKKWDKSRLDIVPGEEVMQKVFAKYGLRYKKERDGIGLTSVLLSEEVHDDLKRIIEKTCAA